MSRMKAAEATSQPANRAEEAVSHHKEIDDFIPLDYGAYNNDEDDYF